MEQRYQAQKLEAIGTLAGGIAHDFNNVLSSITGNLYLIKKHAGDKEKVEHRADLVQAVCLQASEHIRQLLSFARRDSVQMSNVDMQACVHAGCEMADTAIPGGIELSCSCPQGNIYTHWNDTQVQQVLLNLITNASHALEGVANAKIRVELDLFRNNSDFRKAHPKMRDDTYVRLSVRDNGSGMSAEVQRKIFDPFFSTKEEGKGTGLGLSMVIGSVSNAGGIIEVESTIGTGTVFTMYLPAAI